MRTGHQTLPIFFLFGGAGSRDYHRGMGVGICLHTTGYCTSATLYYNYPARACASKGLCDRSWCLYIVYYIIHLLHPLLLNTKIYYTQGGIFATEGVINLVFNIVEGA